MQAQLHKDQLAPPKGVQAACRRGLELRPKYGGDGLTDTAVSRARSMASGKAVSADTLKRIKAYHARHTYQKQSSPPSPGYVAYLLWGGQAGKSWANAKADNVQKAAKKKGKKNLVGGNKGAWAHAKEQAKGKENPDAYAAAIFRRITKKSLVKSEGSRGGHIIGHTKSGKPIYSAHHDMNRVRGKSALHASHELIGYSRADHADAASRHMRAYQKLSGTKPNRAMAHLKLAAGHSGIATGKDLMKPVKQPKAEMSGMHSSYENHKGLAAFHLREGDMKTKVAPEEALWHYAQAGLHSDKAITMGQRTN